MKKFVQFLSIALLVVLLAGLFASSNALANQEPAKLRVFVQYAPGERAAAERALARNGAEFHYSFDDLSSFSVSLPAAAFDGLRRNPSIVLIEDDTERYPIGIMQSNATEAITAGQTIPYGIDMVQARDVWDANRDGTVDSGAPTGSTRKICIIDSGYYTGHEDLPGGVSGYNGNLAWNQDGFGHGTHVAGTIAAMNNALGVIGVTPGTVQLYIVRVFGNDGAWAYSSDLINAANKCRDAGANIISMSLGGSRASTTERNGFATLYNTNGILSIAAAGNAGTTAYSYPASYDTVVSVAAIDVNKVVADFSQKNNQVELAAPGVAVLSTVPYLDNTSLTVDGVTYPAGHIDFSARGSATGALVNGGICDSVGSWSGKVVLCERGTVSFYDKVHNVQLGGGAAAVIYNNVPGGFLGTLGDGNSSTIVGISLSQEDGQYLIANKLNLSATVNSTFTQPGSGYEAWDGTSMATPHVSAVAALVWSSKTSATNAEIRSALQQSAQDLGTAGRDNSYGYGLVQAKAAIDKLGSGGGGGTGQLHVGSMTSTKSTIRNKWSATVTTTVLDQNNVAVSGVTVTGSWSGAKTGTATCTTGTNGACSVTASNMTGTSVTFSVTNLAKTGYTYNSSANVVSSITVTK